ncbi:MAG TPA: hypothetical protein PLW31_03905 [Bacteroidales bacterium]|nr:hypothetical protein [Bacteroidales bacterium]
MEELKRRLSICLSLLFEEDFHLIKEDLHERTISHKLASYLQQVFHFYHVDCEYNGNVDNEDRRKKIDRYLRNREIHLDEEDHSVFPDIIIHERGINDRNRLVIEIKKSTNHYIDFDLEKLGFYTNSLQNREYPYDFGCFIKIYTGDENIKRYEMTWFHEGAAIPTETVNLQ